MTLRQTSMVRLTKVRTALRRGLRSEHERGAMSAKLGISDRLGHDDCLISFGARATASPLSATP
jgi:hypothetical protein